MIGCVAQVPTRATRLFMTGLAELAELLAQAYSIRNHNVATKALIRSLESSPFVTLFIS